MSGIGKELFLAAPVARVREFLTTLKSQLEHGIDLRDRDPATADSVSVGYNRG